MSGDGSKPASRCTIPTMPKQEPGDDARWSTSHQKLMAKTKTMEPDIVFIGDSLFQELEQRPTWNDLFEPLHSLNLGISFEPVENLLYRIQDGIFKYIKPKIVVLHTGSLNLGDDPKDVAEGIATAVNMIQSEVSDAFVIVMGILPRGRLPNPWREKNDRTNGALQERYKDSKTVTVSNTGSLLLRSDGSLSESDMPDYSVPTDTACRKLFEPIYDLILHHLGDYDLNKD